MHRPTLIPMMAIATLCACSQAAERNDSAAMANGTLPAPAAPATPPAPGTPGGLPDDRTPLNEPNGPIDPKSDEAAGQVVQLYGALVEQGKFAEAGQQWGDAGLAAQFAAGLQAYSELHLQVGKPGGSEGAAGSIFITVPVVFYGRGSGGPFSRKADVILRRVNDVDGSTAAQRRWHIERIEWTGG